MRKASANIASTHERTSAWTSGVTGTLVTASAGTAVPLAGTGAAGGVLNSGHSQRSV